MKAAWFLSIVFWATLCGQLVFDIARAQVPLVELKPKEWLGKCLPVLARVSIRDRLAKGEWKVILYRPGCPACQSLMEKYESVAGGLGARADSRIAFIEVRYSGNPITSSAFRESNFTFGQLEIPDNWLVTTPAEFMLRDCIVTRVD